MGQMCLQSAAPRLRRPRQRGISLLLLSIVLTVVMAVLGAGVELAQLYTLRSELQSFTDATALEAASHLDGLKQGILQAQSVVEHARTPAVPELTISYLDAPAGAPRSFSAARGADEDPLTTPNPVRYVAVVATATVPVTLVRFLPGVAQSSTVQARSVAGAVPAGNTSLLPLTATAPDPADHHYWGFVPGQTYDIAIAEALDLGQGAAAAALREAIISGGYPVQPLVLPAAATTVTPESPESVYQALATRAAQDTDTAAESYEAYAGNGRRLVLVPVRNGEHVIQGYGAFLLPPPAHLAANSGAVHALYIGPANQNARSTGALDGRLLYRTALVH